MTAVDTAQARVNAARTEMRRVERLFHNYGSASRAELQEARAEYRDALRELRDAEHEEVRD
ncbi:hypothetical protein [Isoptericola sp. NPDC055881]